MEDRFRIHLTPAGVFLLALALRLFYLLQVRDTPFFDTPLIDAEMYDQHALAIARGDWFGGKLFYQAPLYAYFLAGVYRLFGHDYILVRVVQACLGALNCLLLVFLGRRVFGQAAGCVGGITAALYGVLIFYDLELLRPVLIIFLTLLLLLALLRAGEKPSPGRVVAAGLLFGLSAVTQENILLFLPAALLWLAAARLKRDGRGKVAANSLLVILAVLLVILPVTWRNWRISGDVVPISAQGGLNFYIGNNPDYDNSFSLQPGAGWEEMAIQPGRREGLWRNSEQSWWFFRQSLSWMKEHPADWLALMLKKSVFFLNGHELDPNNTMDYYREQSSLLRVLVWPRSLVAAPFGLIAPLGLLGVFLAGLRLRRVILLDLFLGTYMAAVVLFHVRARYRLPAVPVLILFAAYALLRLVSWVSGRAWGKSLAAVAALALLGILVNADFYGIRSVGEMPINASLGQAFRKKGDLSRAAEEFEKAAALTPRDATVQANLGVVYAALGRDGDAERAYREAISLKPDFTVPYNNLGNFYLNRGRLAEAEDVLTRVLKIYPYYTRALNNLGTVYLRQGRLEEAEGSLRTALRIDPTYASAAYALGLVLLQQQSYAEAAVHLATAVRLDPRNAEARRALEFARSQP